MPWSPGRKQGNPQYFDAEGTATGPAVHVSESAPPEVSGSSATTQVVYLVVAPKKRWLLGGKRDGCEVAKQRQSLLKVILLSLEPCCGVQVVGYRRYRQVINSMESTCRSIEDWSWMAVFEGCLKASLQTWRHEIYCTVDVAKTYRSSMTFHIWAEIFLHSVQTFRTCRQNCKLSSNMPRQRVFSHAKIKRNTQLTIQKNWEWSHLEVFLWS